MNAVALVILAYFSISAQAAKKGDCTAAAPVALLEQSAYKDHSFQREKEIENGAFEAATLSDGANLRIEFQGCADAATKIFIFTVPKDSHPATNAKFWAAWAGQEIDGLKFTKEAKFLQPLLEKFLKKAPTLPGLNKDDVDVSECMDGSKPTRDGCSFDQLGLYELAAKKKGDGVRVTLTWSENL